MLNLTQVPSQKIEIYLPDGRVITIYGHKRDHQRIGIDAPSDIKILRVPNPLHKPNKNKS